MKIDINTLNPGREPHAPLVIPRDMRFFAVTFVDQRGPVDEAGQLPSSTFALFHENCDNALSHVLKQARDILKQPLEVISIQEFYNGEEIGGICQTPIGWRIFIVTEGGQRVIQ